MRAKGMKIYVFGGPPAGAGPPGVLVMNQEQS